MGPVTPQGPSDLPGGTVPTSSTDASSQPTPLRPQDNLEREETWLSVWVHEAKGLPRAAAGTAGVRAELWLDGALLARTAPRAGPGQLFWAERFHFEALPPARRLSLRLRGAGPGGATLGRVALALEELGVPRAPAAGLERWFPLLGSPAGAALRARIRARRLRVLPSERYKELAEFLTFHYARLCGALEPALSAQAKEELAAAMVRVLQATGRAQVRLCDGADPSDQRPTDRVPRGAGCKGGRWRRTPVAQTRGGAPSGEEPEFQPRGVGPELRL